MDSVKNIPNTKSLERRELDYTWGFTQIHQSTQGLHPSLREAEIRAWQYPERLQPLMSHQLFAGRKKDLIVGLEFDAIYRFGYCGALEKLYQNYQNCHTGPDRLKWKQIYEYWKENDTSIKARNTFSDEIQKYLPSNEWYSDVYIGMPLFRMAPNGIDYVFLLQQGLPGLKQFCENKINNKESDESIRNHYLGIRKTLDVFNHCLRYYEKQAEELAEKSKNTSDKKNLLKLQDCLKNLQKRKPESLYEAIQFVWIYTLLAGNLNYSRMDIALAPFLMADRERGVSENEHLSIIRQWYRAINEEETLNEYNARIILGGKGRKNIAAEDTFSRLAIEAIRLERDILPQVTLRFYQGQNPDLYELSLKAISEGCTFPILYNDDVNIKAYAELMNISEKEAEGYIPFGCGEYTLESQANISPNSVINLVKSLEATLNNGNCLQSEELVGLKLGYLADYTDFESLYAAYRKQNQHIIRLLAQAAKITWDTFAQSAPFHLLCLAYPDSREKNSSPFLEGIKYKGNQIETYGNADAINSLFAIKRLVFEEKSVTAEALMDAVKNDFEGHGDLRQKLLTCDKYGNDQAEIDAWAQRFHRDICLDIKDGEKHTPGFLSQTVIINNHANTQMGWNTAASPDGRKNTEALAPGNNPTPGSDRNGITSMLNSMAKLDPSVHAGAVQNMKINRELFNDPESFEKWKSLLKVYFLKGGTQAMITVVSQKDLQDAMLHPERHPTLLVRVGGFSARFVDLMPDVQREIIHRTAHG